jgi:hypothetical protein
MSLPVEILYTPNAKLKQEGAQFIDQVLNAIDKTRKLISENISKAQAEYKHYHDKTIKATPPSYVPGSRV